MTDEVREYAEKRILESGIRKVPGHYPDFQSREHVDKWLEMSLYMFEHWDDENIWDMTDVDQVKYVAMLNQLKKNRDNVPPELLKTRYRKPYGELRNRLRTMTCQIVYDAVMSGLLIEYENADAVYEEINQEIEKSGLAKEISRAVFLDQDIVQVEEKAMELRKKVHAIAERRLDDD